MKYARLTRRLVASAALVLSAGFGSLATSGCNAARGPAYGEFTATPVFSTRERFSRINRNIDIELKMLNDDLDQLLLLRPVSSLTEWNIP
jgi:hypothetical protein